MACDLAISTYPWHSPTISILGLVHYFQIYPRKVKLPAITTIQYKNSLIWPRASIAACSYSHGEAKPTNKDENLMMAEKMIGKHTNRLREACGQFSSQFHKPFLRKCLYKNTVPENMADPPKNFGKIKKKCRIASFHWGQCVHHVSNNIIKQFPHKKILTFNLHNCIPTDGKGEEQAKYHNVPQFALSRMIIVTWPAFSASKRILRTRFLCSKPWSERCNIAT